MQCAWERSEIALEKLINFLDTDNTDMWNGSTYTDHKTKTIFSCLLHPFSALFLDTGVKTFFVKKPLLIHLATILAHIQYWEEGEKSWATCFCFFFSELERETKGVYSKSSHFLYEKKEFSGIFLCGERSECNPFYFHWPPTIWLV